jgi:hypothetical protein
MDLLQNRREEIEAKLLEALDSDPIEVTPEFWEERRRRLEKVIAAKGHP